MFYTQLIFVLISVGMRNISHDATRNLKASVIGITCNQLATEWVRNSDALTRTGFRALVHSHAKYGKPELRFLVGVLLLHRLQKR